jgi:tetratricopeptide (TPR) repeat protein
VPDDKTDHDNAVPFPAGRVHADRAEQVYALARQLKRERQAAPRIVDAILRDTPREQLAQLVEHPALRNCGALERLGVLVTAELTRDPRYAETIAQLAVSLAEALPPNAYPSLTAAQSRSYAWKDLGKTLSFLGRQEEAIAAFVQAQSEIEDLPTLAHDRAIIRFNLSITYQEIGRHDEALALLTECKEVFHGYRDTRLLVICGLAEGVLLQRLGHYREARETYLLLIASSTGIEKESLAALHRAIGFCSIELGDFDDAEDNLVKAIGLHQQLGQAVEVVKGELGRGRLLIRRGDHQSGIAHLRPVRHQFLRHSLAEEAGLCGLDMVEGMLLAGEPAQAESLARTIMNEFLAANMNTRAITALGYLTEAIASRKASSGMAVQVREYVLSLRTAPEREFTALC